MHHYSAVSRVKDTLLTAEEHSSLLGWPYLVFLSWLPLPARLILLVGERELDISFLKGVGVDLRLVISICYSSSEMLVPPGSIHLHAFFGNLEWPFRRRHHPG